MASMLGDNCMSYKCLFMNLTCWFPAWPYNGGEHHSKGKGMQFYNWEEKQRFFVFHSVLCVANSSCLYYKLVWKNSKLNSSQLEKVPAFLMYVTQKISASWNLAKQKLIIWGKCVHVLKRDCGETPHRTGCGESGICIFTERKVFMHLCWATLELP